MKEESYHQRIKEEKRTAAVRAAMALFLEQGYERTSLQQVAKRADVSTATLFKRFPTKGALFEAIIEEFWEVDTPCEGPAPTGDPQRGLYKIGANYVGKMRNPEMAAVYRLIISETLRFPDLGQILFDRGKGPYLAWLDAYLAAEIGAGTLAVPDIARASREFLAMIAGQAFWPELVVPGCGGTEEEADAVVRHAVAFMLARYGRSKS
jgi:TetR/AcrR family transcriptional regulator of autoinduction and epiphytic fitness